jgi:dihydrofolate reductase
MRKLRIIEHISLDGVIQHSADDDDFLYSDWTAPYRTPAGRDAIMAAYGGRFDLLLGRRTYNIWSGFWPKAPSSPIEDGLNAMDRRHWLPSLRFLLAACLLNPPLQFPIRCHYVNCGHSPRSSGIL